MAKLVEIAVRDVQTWDDRWIDLQQVRDGTLVVRDKNHYGYVLFPAEIAEDYDESPVATRPQWEAERARVAANQQATSEALEIARTGAMATEEQELADIACGNRSREDQALWDKVAVALAPAVYAECCKGMDATGYPENWREGVAKDWVVTVDAFMEERAKRMKGGV